MPRKSKKFICYNIGFNDKVFDESGEARATAEHIGAQLKSIQLDKIGVDHIRNLSTIYDEPFADSSALPSFEVCKAGASEATVFLTGDAGDEAFGGYNRYIKRLRYDSIHNLIGISRISESIRNYVPQKFSSTIDKLTSDSGLRDAYYDNIPTSLLSNGLLHQAYHQKFTDFFLERVRNF